MHIWPLSTPPHLAFCLSSSKTIPWTNIYIYIRICIRTKDICITRFSFSPSQGCDHVCISNKDFASSIAGTWHFEVILFYPFEVLTHVSTLGYPFLSFWGFNSCLDIRLSSIQYFEVLTHVFALGYPLFIISYDHLHLLRNKRKSKILFKEMTVKTRRRHSFKVLFHWQWVSPIE